jgi:capsular exopolysaccharide synthesis family protein
MSSSSSTPGGLGGVRYVHAILAHWRLILGLALAAVLSALIVLALATKRYQATADILITPVPATDTTYQGFSVFRQSLDGSSSVVTAARVMGTPQIRQRAFANLPGKGRGVSISIVPLSQADIVSVQATAPSAAEAAAAANNYADAVAATRTDLFHSELLARIAQLQRQVSAFPAATRQNNLTYIGLQQQLSQLQGAVGLPDPTLRVLDRAQPPAAASWPRPKLTLAITLLIALLLGFGAAILLETMNPRVTRESDLTLEHRLPILARVPRLPRGTVEGYMMRTVPLPSEVWKSYQTLRAVLATAGRNGGYPKSILVTSATASDGKTMTALNLAITLANADLRVLLIDADFHRPMVGTIFDAKVRRDGFVRLLRQEASLAEASIPAAGYPHLRLVLSGAEHAHASSILESDRVDELLRKLETEVDVVVIDAPPVPEVTESLWVAAAAEVVLLCVRVGHTRRDKLELLRDLLGRRGVTPLGFVVTTRERPRPDEYGAYGYTHPEAKEGIPSPRSRAVTLRTRAARGTASPDARARRKA